MSITPEIVAQLLESEDLGDRLSAVNQMRHLSGPDAFALLKQAVEDRNARVRYAAVSQLSSAGHEDREQSLEILRDRLFRDSEMDVKAAAADAIGALQLTEAYPDLETSFHATEDWLLRMSIVSTLGELGDPRAFDLLKTAINSPEPLVQGAAIGALGELKNQQAVPLLQPFAANEDWQIRYRVAQALGNLGGAEARAILEILNQDPMAQVAQMANLALAQVGEL